MSKSVCLSRQSCVEVRVVQDRILTRITVANEQGSFTTPSFVSFTDEERLIGEAAKNQAAMNPANTVFDVK
jgi:molecular chaperone DnaK (HSP70)